jgi:hypothetical protein
MADITKCSGEGCPHKEGCYRFTAHESYLQSYFLDPPITKNNKCDYYWGDNGELIWNKAKETKKE